MTVKELERRLIGLDPDAQVVVSNGALELMTATDLGDVVVEDGIVFLAMADPEGY